ncbi:nitrate reductase [Sulfurovum lithotrophicum]|uniref:Nitrate reductase n=1 Tax=Sulfurovum lithotrophicum TaxID=206403 RepID=A0A7U4M147_9BACT|nr:nitrate reductase [Sulfurovum lithotrophicum]AKF24829.1 nitrate reductase [Sulfurovum lithotrophicum]
MFRFATLLFLLLSTTWAKDISPVATIEVSGLVSDFVEDHGYLYVATDAGIVDVIDLSSQKIVRQIILPPLETVQNGKVPSRIHAIDRYQNKTLLVTSASNAYREVWIEQNGHLRKIIGSDQHIMPKNAFFNKEGKIIFGTFGSDVILYDNLESYRIYEQHISESTMGGMVLSDDKNKMVISDESGAVRIIDVNTSKIDQVYDKEHVDNIYKVAYANGVILTAGQDRRVGVYFTDSDNSYHLKSDFLVYCVGLSPKATTGVYSSGIEHHLQLFNPATKSKGDRLVGHYATPTKILFINEKAMISSGDEDKVFFWLLP